MVLFTIGFTKKSASQFFDLVRQSNIKLMIDIRLNNSSQLAGFSKGGDLEYFLKEICNCGYRYEPIFAPTKEMMDNFKNGKITFAKFQADYIELMDKRNAIQFSDSLLTSGTICLLCSEFTPEHCHRSILAEAIKKQHSDVIIKHL